MSRSSTTKHANANIFIYEDEAITAVHLVKLLSRNGFNVLGSSDGISCNSSKSFDCHISNKINGHPCSSKECVQSKANVFVVDLNLKGKLSGIDLICGMQKHCNINKPLVFITAENNLTFYKDSFSQLPYFVETKPIREKSLVCNIQNALSIFDIYTELEDKIGNFKLQGKAITSVNRELLKVTTSINELNKKSKKDLLLAENVQKDYYQGVPENLKDWDVALHFSPAMSVSGDFYDFYQKDEELLGVSLFDVSGHGPAAGLLAMMSKTVIRKHILASCESEKSLSSIMSLCNEELTVELKNLDNFITGVMLKFKKDKIIYVNAGHPNALIKNGDQAKPLLNEEDRSPTGTVLGIDELATEYEELEIGIEKNEFLLLYTDGITEAFNNGEEYGDDRLIKTFSSAPGETADEVLNFIKNDLNNFTKGAPINDDVAIIVLKRI